jgi:hypothetical protein
MGDSFAARISRIKRLLADQGRRMNPCVNEEVIEAFEQRHRIRLPQEYRLFLKEVGNGGKGPPYYGLLPLGEVPRDYDRLFADVLKHLHKPFPLTTYWVWEGEPEAKPELHEAINHGNLVLGTDGCAMYWLLIVTGPERGQIWQRADVGITPCAPRRDFLSWYEYWLEGGEDWWSDFQT